MKVLITGADGQLGHELRGVLHAEQLTCGDLPEFDVTRTGIEEQIRSMHPDMIIHAAAYTNVDRAEQEPDKAMAVNAEGTERVARAAAHIGARLVYISTDYVFDGHKGTPYLESDVPNPVNVYGRSKLEGERRALQHCPDGLIVRTAWLYGAHGHNFVKTIMKLALEHSDLRVVSDQRGCPTYARDLAVAITRMLEARLKGIVHATGSGDCTWHEFAREIVALMGLTVPVHSITTAESQRPAQRPSYAVLANQVLAEAGIRLPHWKDALNRYMSEDETVRSSKFEVPQPRTQNLEPRTRTKA